VTALIKSGDPRSRKSPAGSAESRALASRAAMGYFEISRSKNPYSPQNIGNPRRWFHTYT
jgi:hypothetical protein